MNTTFAALNFATFDLRVVALSDLEARPEYAVNLDSLDDLLRSFSLQVDTHHLTVLNDRVLDLDCVIRVSQAIDSTSSEIVELSV